MTGGEYFRISQQSESESFRSNQLVLPSMPKGEIVGIITDKKKVGIPITMRDCWHFNKDIEKVVDDYGYN